ncbi:hypothetical protein A2U01_0006251, partial [Trifolium medium]|nr:hypothetical protein [Trifolium medium]
NLFISLVHLLLFSCRFSSFKSLLEVIATAAVIALWYLETDGDLVQSPDLWQWRPDPIRGLPTRVNLASRGIITPDMLSLVLPVARTWNQLSTCSFPAVPLAPFGRQLGLGLVCFRWILTIWQTIFSSLLSQHVVSERVAPFCSLFGSFTFG